LLHFFFITPQLEMQQIQLYQIPPELDLWSHIWPERRCIFNVHQLYCTCYWYRLDVCLSVCPSHTGIVPKRLNLSSNCLHFL